MRLRRTIAIIAAALTALVAPTLAHAASDPISALLSKTQVRSQAAFDAPVKEAISTAPSLNALTGWQCAQFARLFSGIQIFGDAGTWWEQAVGKYARGFTPQAGSVLVFRPYGPMTRGHVAVVSQVLTERIIQVTHANWSLINGKRGQVEKDVTVADVSPAGDWSQVKVWYGPSGDLGRSVYPTYGFVYKTADRAVTTMASVANALGFGGSN